RSMRCASGLGHDRSDFFYPLLLVAFASVLVNSSLAIFNLIPLPPLDGFGVLESLMPARLWNITHFLRRFGFIILFAAVYLGLLNPIFRVVYVPLRSCLLGGLQ